MIFFKYKKQISAFLMFFLLIPIMTLVNPHKAEAVWPVVEGGMNLFTNIKNTVESTYTKISTGITSNSTLGSFLKETVGDPLATISKKILLRQITTSTVNWINNGFNGSPAFISDFDGFMTDIADRTIGGYIYGTKLKFLCGPLRPGIQMALNNRTYRSIPACRLSGIENNINNAVNNFNISWNWNTWQTLTSDVRGNSYLGFEYAVLGNNKETAAALKNAGIKAKMNNGFLSWETCPTSWGSLSAKEKANYSDESGYKENCPGKQTNTPGSVIYSQLNSTLRSGLKDLEFADEINEVVGALASQVVSQVLGPGGGLRGTSKSSGGESRSFLDKMNNEKLLNNNLLSTMAENITENIKDGEGFLVVKKESLAAVTSAKALGDTLLSCRDYNLYQLQARLDELSLLNPDAISRTVTVQADEDLSYITLQRQITASTEIAIIEQGIISAQNSRSQAQEILDSQINPIYEKLTDEILNTTEALTKLKTLQNETSQLTDKNINEFQNRYQKLQGGIQTQANIANAKQEKNGFPVDIPNEPKGIIKDMEAVKEIIAPLQQECQVFTVDEYVQTAVAQQ